MKTLTKEKHLEVAKSVIAAVTGREAEYVPALDGWRVYEPAEDNTLEFNRPDLVELGETVETAYERWVIGEDLAKLVSTEGFGFEVLPTADDGAPCWNWHAWELDDAGNPDDIASGHTSVSQAEARSLALAVISVRRKSRA